MADDEIPPPPTPEVEGVDAGEIEPANPTGLRQEVELHPDTTLLLEGGTRTNQLHARMLKSRASEASEAEQELQLLYQDLFANLLLEASVIPGFNLAQEMLLERLAAIWTEMKRLDTLDDPIRPSHYEKLFGRYLQALNTLFKSRSDRDADEAFQRNFVSKVVNAVLEVVNEELSDQPELSVKLQRRIVESLRRVRDGNHREAP